MGEALPMVDTKRIPPLHPSTSPKQLLRQLRTLPEIQRRTFLRRVGGASAFAALAGHGFANTALAQGSRLFKLGVASGDPHSHGFTLWTRLAPEPLIPGGGMNPEPVHLRYEVALDPEMNWVVRSGYTVARPEHGHNVKVHVNGLPCDRWYWYRFIVDGEASPIGRSRTFPWFWQHCDSMRFALVSCQDYQNGYYSAYRNLAEEDIDAVFHVGDYIYEYGPNPKGVRQHSGPEIQTLEDYRIRYAQYRLDPALQAAHAAFPFICTWDDHEVDNNYAGLIPEAGQDPAPFKKRRQDAYRAYWEAMPMMPSVRLRKNGMRLYRQIEFGTLASFFVLDSRQFRSDQPCDPKDEAIQPACDERLEASQTMLGRRQMRWLKRGMGRSWAQWNLLAQQVMFTPWNIQAVNPLASEIYNMDAWDGYPIARQRVKNVMTRYCPYNPIVLTGDIHSSWAAEIREDDKDPKSAKIAAEFVTTSISSDFPQQFIPLVQATLADNPQIRYFDGSYRGYVRFELNEMQCRVDYRAVKSILDPQSSISTVASFVVEDGDSTIHRA